MLGRKSPMIWAASPISTVTGGKWELASEVQDAGNQLSVHCVSDFGYESTISGADYQLGVDGCGGNLAWLTRDLHLLETRAHDDASYGFSLAIGQELGPSGVRTIYHGSRTGV